MKLENNNALALESLPNQSDLMKPANIMEHISAEQLLSNNYAHHRPNTPPISNHHLENINKLYQYVEEGNLKSAQEILETGLNPNFEINFPLQKSGESSDSNICPEMKYTGTVYPPQDHYLWLLDVASKNANLEMIQLLIKYGAKATNGNPIKALAICHHPKNKIESIHYKNIIHNLINAGTSHPLPLEILKLFGCKNILDIQYLQNPNLNLKLNIKFKLYMNNILDYFDVNHLIPFRFSDIPRLDITKKNHDISALTYCAQEGSLEVVQYLLTQGLTLLPAKSTSGFYIYSNTEDYNSAFDPIIIAIINNQTELLETFNKLRPLNKIRIDFHFSRFKMNEISYTPGESFKENMATLAGLASLFKNTEMLNKLFALDVHPNTTDLLWAASVSDGLFEILKKNKTSLYEKPDTLLALIQVFIKTCQLDRLKETLKDLRTHMNSTLTKNIAIQNHNKCEVGIELIRSYFPSIKVLK